ncbi:MAG: hypothetical protein GIKADHBN_03236 [Phycisphaerales bacterium]|nr:hypothetical protein [Phycisphaerales bacterium]
MLPAAAKMPAALITAPLPKITPAGLTMNTRPLASSLPSIFVGAAELIRLSTRASESGWTNWTVSLPAMSKLL